MIKMILMAGLVTAALASSAMAQSYDPEVGSGNIVPDTNWSPTRPTVNEPYYGARAFAPESRAYARDSYAQQPAPRHHLHFHTMQGHSDMDRM
jgi:hypothetical protein